MMRIKLLALLCTVLFVASTPAEPLTKNAMIQSMHKAATRQRANYRMPAQVLDENLCNIAQRWANNMAARDRMYHGGGEQVVAVGYPNAEACIQGWINSGGHRVWVLGRNGKCGFGSARSASGRMYYAGVYR